MPEKVRSLNGAAATAAAAVMELAGVAEDGPMFVSGPGDVSRPTAALTEPVREPEEAATEGQGTCRMVRGGKGRTTSRAAIPPAQLTLDPPGEGEMEEDAPLELVPLGEAMRAVGLQGGKRTRDPLAPGW